MTTKTKSSIGRKLTRAASAGAIAVACLSTSAFAQGGGDVPPETEDFTNENLIIVTGITKQAEDIQEVPTTITAFSGEQLEAQGIDEFADVAAFTPGFSVRSAGNNPTALNLQMRGQIQNDSLATLEPSVGVYIDELYVARAYGLNTELVDIQSVQVLKGPQGTLFGRNTSAGAVLLQTADPEFDAVYGVLKGSYGRFDQVDGTAIINLGFDRFAVRGAFFYGERDDYQVDITDPDREGYGARETLNGRVKLSFDITETLNFLASAEYYDSQIDGPARANRAFACVSAPCRALGGGAPFDPAVDFRTTRDDFDEVAVTDPALAPGAPPQGIFNDLETQTYIVELSLDTFFGEAKFIGGYRKVEGNNLIDLDGFSGPFNHFTQGIQDLKQYSGELQVTGTTLNDFVDFAAGMTYFHEEGLDISRSNFSAAPTPNVIWSGFQGDIDNDSLGVYAQVSVHATDRLSINGGVRYSVDDKAVMTQSAVFPFNRDVPAVCLPVSLTRDNNGDGAFTAEDCNLFADDTFDAISYTIGADYQFTDDILIYAKQSRGYRSGALQLRVLQVPPPPAAQPEIVNEQEIGLKTRFLNDRVTFNIAGYHNEVAGAQRSVILAVNGVNQTVLENADTETYGVEADLAVEVSEGLVFYASGSLTDPDYTQYTGFEVAGAAPNQMLVSIDKSDARFVGIVEESFTIGTNFNAPLSFGTLNFNGSYAWQGESNQASEIARDFINNGVPAPRVDEYLELTTSESLGLLNARASIAFGPEENYEVAVWGRNILDDRSAAYSLYLSNGLNYIGSFFNEPATYGITLTARLGN